MEVWKDVYGFEGLYQVSNYGRIRSVIKGVERILKPQTNKAGYHVNRLSKKGVYTTYLLHRLIAEVFIPNPERKPFVNHINAIRSDNRVENIEWCTPKENSVHAVSNNLYKAAKGEDHGQSKITKEQALMVVELSKKYPKKYGRNKAIADIMGLSPAHVWNILSGKTWNHVTNINTTHR